MLSSSNKQAHIDWGACIFSGVAILYYITPRVDLIQRSYIILYAVVLSILQPTATINFINDPLYYNTIAMEGGELSLASHMGASSTN